MEMKKKTWFALLLLLVIFSACEVEKGDARDCKAQSHKFKGPCSRDHNCAVVCRTEGFSGGDCQGFRRRCFCTRSC